MNKRISHGIKNQLTTIVIFSGSRSTCSATFGSSLTQLFDLRNRLIDKCHTKMHYAQDSTGITTLVFLVYMRDNCTPVPAGIVSKNSTCNKLAGSLLIRDGTGMFIYFILRDFKRSCVIYRIKIQLPSVKALIPNFTYMYWLIQRI